MMQISLLSDFSLLDAFNCGIKEMDSFIHETLEQSVKSHFCVPYILWDEKNIYAFFSLSCDSLIIDTDYIDDMLSGCASSDKPKLAPDYIDTFMHKQHYPAVDISFLAVDERFQRKGIGTKIVEDIVQYVRDNSFYGCQFIVVDALVTKDYDAVTFYSKNKFTVCEDKKPNKDCVRMYRPLYEIGKN